LTHLTTVVCLHEQQHPEDGRITGRKMWVRIL